MESPLIPDRRQVLTAAATLALAPVTMAPAARAQETRMLTRPIPSTGEPLPVVGFGTWQTFDVGTGPAERAQRRQVLEALFDAGGKVIDSSPMYGRAEAVVGDLLADMKARDKAFLATKVWTSGEKAGLAQMQSSADKFYTKTIDLMQIHNLVDWRTHMKSLRAGKESGRYRTIGITHYTVPALDELATILEREPFDFVQMGYSLNTRAAEKRLLPVAAARGVAVIVNQPFDSGSMFARAKGKPLPTWAAEIGCTSWAQIMLKYLLGHPAVTCVIPGTASPGHARDNIASGLAPLPDEAMRRRMVTAWDGL